MTLTVNDALDFLETQWASANQNKVNGILTEVRFKSLLTSHNVHWTPGGWILTPGNNSKTTLPTRSKVCLIPQLPAFPWLPAQAPNPCPSLTQVSAFSFFKQMGVDAYFAQSSGAIPNSFALPTPSSSRTATSPVRPASYPASIGVQLVQIQPTGPAAVVPDAQVFSNFPGRSGARGLRAYPLGRLDRSSSPWTSPSVVAELFWFEYVRYYFNRTYLQSNNDLDLFIHGPSGRVYPVEVKGKTPAYDNSIGEWFGIDIGPFAKFSFFTANSNNNDALYVVEEVTPQRNHVAWHAITFTELVKACAWVGRGGGTGMTGGASSTYRVPKAAFSSFRSLLPSL